ncbi:TPA: ead/Ea22-like family protein [Klebsiella pneumoniae]|uniref:ead/Ea22-like family protein n=1 Tax=Klebsiella TaxID=570 RepID=UPI0007CA1786|nr:ead/Ea22-like family protein [Klebsiella pneumoniae]MCC5745299.1 ead/Ea22-like family protein [Klebsiella pneumoniae]MCF2769093.1 ead/Ea22-like family protein [Klebsiella pneumoniae]MCF2781160.1 ead/Ea22-like family protein [Klebsiella pneumoniae]MCF6854079.1 ead/Ea22-like family protein [Klebsiella pneumoniae]MCF6960286.1 ead/Ea22-like family protein [Klebsiella pneumoniae]
MTTDITELAQSEINDALAQLKQISEYPTPSTQYARVLRKYILALVEALEKAQAENTAGVAGMAESYETTISMLRSRIAELESRTVTVKQGEVLVTVAGFTGCGKSAIAGEIEIAMKAIGVPVTWANGDSEKRMTGADWLTAIEMYKPTVRIVEVNIPRAAGIKVEAE